MKKKKYYSRKKYNSKKLNIDNNNSTVTKSWASANVEIRLYAIYSFVVFLAIEWIFRGSIGKFFGFMMDYPLAFIVNWILLFLIFAVAIFVSKKKFYLYVSTFILILLVTASRIVNDMRGMPISPYDLYSYKEAFEVSNIFLSFKGIALIVICISLAIGISVIVYKRDKGYIRTRVKRNMFVYIVLMSIFLIVTPQLRSAKILVPIAWNVNISYQHNGFVYSFLSETISSFRRKPKGYSRKTIEEIRKEVDKREKNDKRVLGQNNPDIIVVQLEAFMDPTRIKNVTFNQDPMPNMRKLMKNYTSGHMNVPVTGGGTARTEYEILSGANFDYLNPGEIPYQTFLAENDSISMARTLSKSGYKASAIHNFNMRFYNRDKGYRHLGFGKFIPGESMTNLEHTPLGWPKDSVLTRYIMDELGSKDSKNTKPSFVFTVSTQGHGSYPSSRMAMPYPIKIEKASMNPAFKNQVEYYANQVYEMDKFVGDLVGEINKRKKPTVLVLYGDHLPGLSLFRTYPENEYLYSSIFALVNNYGTRKLDVGKDFQAYQMSSLIMKAAGQKYGPFDLINAYMRNDKDYQKKLELVQYDVLFGKKYFLKDSEVPEANKMTIGNGSLKIKKVENRGGDFYIVGEGFNRNARVYIDGKEVEADFKDDKNIRLYDSFYSGVKKIELRLFDSHRNEIYKSNVYKFKF
ncbi:MAG: LTA synthase family protein [Peptostreptococcus anaerobius]|uniref:LTA synthase family protein n=1 Tax=Peptostreptococcus anaerobius TaxID=1261 RepID=UPI002904AA91|nr:LTA synthase family protein [Peptostreptococcus anaerobius]MDU0963767.1 LTA synthase family protein [Peptostreptococcus anaerobius]MDU0997638.1 LTA synthase family protein [Peptostreptococcus anaerobius]